MNTWLLTIVKQINTGARGHLKNNLKRYEITDAQLEVILYLNRNRGIEINQRQLEGELHLSNPTIVSLIDRLEEKGLVVRSLSGRDHRHKFINITELGINMCEALYDDFCEAEAKLLQGISEEEELILNKLLNIVLSNVSNMRGGKND